MDKPVSRSTFLAAPRSRLQRGRVSGEERQKKDNDQTKGLEYTDQTIAEYLFRVQYETGGKRRVEEFGRRFALKSTLSTVSLLVDPSRPSARSPLHFKSTTDK